MLYIIYGNNIQLLKTKLFIFLNERKIKETFSYIEGKESEIINSINQVSLFQLDEVNDDEFYCINDCSFLTKKTKAATSFIERLLSSDKQIICLAVARSQTSFNSILVNNKTNVKWIEAKPFSNIEKRKYIDSLLSQYQITFNCNTTKESFIEKLNNDPFFIKNEIKKIHSFGMNNEVSIEDINALCLNGTNDNIFNLLIYILSNKKENAFKLFDQLILQKMQVVAIVQIISAQLFELKLQKELVIKYSYNFIEKSYSVIGTSSFIIQRNLPIIKKFTLSDFNTLLNKLLFLDYNIKNNIVVPTLAFKLFISQE